MTILPCDLTLIWLSCFRVENYSEGGQWWRTPFIQYSGGGGRQVSELEVGLVCRVSSSVARAMERNPIWENKQNKTKSCLGRKDTGSGDFWSKDRNFLLGAVHWRARWGSRVSVVSSNVLQSWKILREWILSIVTIKRRTKPGQLVWFSHFATSANIRKHAVGINKMA